MLPDWDSPGTPARESSRLMPWAGIGAGTAGAGGGCGRAAGAPGRGGGGRRTPAPMTKTPGPAAPAPPARTRGCSGSRPRPPLAAVLIASAALLAGCCAAAALPHAHADGHQPTVEISSGASSPTNLQTVPFAMKFSKPVSASTLAASDINASSGTVQNLRGPWQPLANFGSEGSEDGKFDLPSGVAVDGPRGKIYVADRDNNRIQVFDAATRSHVDSIGGFSAPYGVAVDGSGKLYVADSGNNRVAVLDSARNVVLSINASSPYGVAVDGSGSIYVADRGNNRVRIYGQAGNTIATISGLNGPAGVAVDGSGTIYVANTNNGTVAVYDSARIHVANLPGTFDAPFGVAADASSGTIYVADLPDDSVYVFDAATRSLIHTFGPGQFDDPLGVAADGSSDTIYVADTRNHRIRVFDAAHAFDVAGPDEGRLVVRLPAGRAQDVAGNANEASNDVSIAIDRTAPAPAVSAAQPGPTNATKIAFRLEFDEGVNLATLDASDISATPGAAQNLHALLRHDGHIGGFHSPQGVAADGSSGTVYVTNSWDGSNQVTIVNRDRQRVGALPGPFNQPGGVTVDGSGRIYVADTFNNRIRVFSPAGEPINTVSHGFSRPHGVAVDDSSGTIYVADTRNDRVRVFDSGWGHVADMGGFDDPYAMAVVGPGNLYVADSRNDIIKIYNSARHQIDSITQGFVQPRGVAVDSLGTTYVADSVNNYVKVFDTDKRLVATLDPGIRTAQTVAVDGSSGTVYVTDNIHGRVLVFNTTFAFEVADPPEGRLEVKLPAGLVRDTAGNANDASNTVAVEIDRTAPVPAVTSAQRSPTSAPTISFTVGFNETVTGFEREDVRLSGTATHGGVASFAAADAATYTFDVSPASDGTILVDVPAGAARDDAGNGNTAAERFSITYNSAVPTPVINASQRSPTNAATINFLVKFNVGVTGFDQGDVRLSGTASHGGVASFAAADAATYTFDVSPASDGTILVDIPEDAADAGGLGSDPAERFSMTYDGTPPAPAVSSAQHSPASASPIGFAVGFNETVTGFEREDVRLSGTAAHGGVKNFAGGGASYSFEVSPTTNGTILVDVPAGAARDAAGNPSSAAARHSVTYAGAPAAPAPALESASLDLEAGSNGRLTLAFDGAATLPDVKSFEGDITIRGGDGTVALSAGDVHSIASGRTGGAEFALDVSGAKRIQLNAADLGSASITLPGGFVSDLGGSPYAGGRPAVPLTYVQDPSPPRLAAAAVDLAPGEGGAARLVLTFDEAVTAPEVQPLAGEIVIRVRGGAAVVLSGADVEAVASGREGDRTFALLVSGAKREALAAAGLPDPPPATVLLPGGFVSNGRSAYAPDPAPLAAADDGAGPSFAWAHVLNGSSVAVVYTEPVLTVPSHYSGITVDGIPAEGNRDAASAAAAFGSSVVVSWNAGAGAEASAGSAVGFDLSGNVTDAFGNPLLNPGQKSTDGQGAGSKMRVQVGAFSRGQGDPTAGAARLGAAAFNALSSERGYPFLVSVTEHALPDGASAAAALRDAHGGGRGPVLYVGPASDAALRGMAEYASENGITVVSHSSAARSLAVEGDGIYRMEPGAAHLARVLATEVARGGYGAIVPVVQADLYGPEYGLLGPLASDLAPLGIPVGEPVEFAEGGGGAAAASIEAAVLAAAGSGSARSAAVVYMGSDSELAAIAGSMRGDSPVRDRSAWFAAGGAGAGAGGGVTASPLVISDAAAVQLARDVRLSAVQFAVERNAATDYVDDVAYGAAGPPGPAGSATPAYAAYEAARVIGRALALAGGNQSEAGGNVARAAALDGGPLGRTGMDSSGDLRLPITYGAWSVSDAAAEWERAPDLLRGIDRCGMALEKSELALPDLSPGSRSGPARQTITNTGAAPMP